MPRSMFSRWKMPMTSMLVRVSRLPVGSSARMIDGSLISARAIATRCCWPPDSWFGIVVVALAEADGLQRLHRALVPLGGLHLAAAVVEQRQLDVVERRRAREQVEALEHEPDLPVADHRELVLRHPRHVLAVEDVLPLVGRSRQPRMCISVDLPDPDGPVTATNSPVSTSRSAPRSARTVTSPTV